jgi:predicted nicotinamide N-methyase
MQCANVMLRVLDARPDVARLVPSSDATVSPLKGVKLCDVSAGTGLIAIGAAVAGAHAVATDIGDQMTLLQQNITESLPVVEAAGCGGSICARTMYWGEDLALACADSVPFDVSVISDVLFIAIRDGLCDKLAATLINLTKHSHCVLFGFEERLIKEEQEFMESLPEISGNCLKIEEICGIEAKKDGS